MRLLLTSDAVARIRNNFYATPAGQRRFILGGMIVFAVSATVCVLNSVFGT